MASLPTGMISSGRRRSISSFIQVEQFRISSGAGTRSPPAAVFPASLTFGKLGTEASLLRCQTSGKDVNGDRLPDLVGIFNSRKTGLGRSDTVAMLQGATVQGAAIQGQDRISIDD